MEKIKEINTEEYAHAILNADTEYDAQRMVIEICDRTEYKAQQDLKSTIFEKLEKRRMELYKQYDNCEENMKDIIMGKTNSLSEILSELTNLK